MASITPAPTPGPASTPPASRRPHRKSRKGCQQCKLRRIKCDEGKPSCGKCLHYQTECSFLQTQPLRRAGPYQVPASSPNTHCSPSTSSPALTTPLAHHAVPISHDIPIALQTTTPHANFDGLDLELLHFWTTTTSRTLDPMQLWQVTIPEIAFSHNFLMHEILAVAALHLARTRPARADIYNTASDKHHQIALKFFQEIPDIDRQNCHATMACASLITVYSWAARTGSLIMVNRNTPVDEKTVEVVQLLRGQGTLHSSFQEWLIDGPLWPMFKPWAQRDPRSEIILPEDEKHLSSLAQLWKPPPPAMSPETTSVLEMSLETLRMVFSIATSDNGVGFIAAALSWSCFIPEPYIHLVQGGTPEALVLLAHYCVLLNRVNDFWWIQGQPQRLLATIRDVLDQNWQRWIEWPLREVGIEFRPAALIALDNM